MGGGWRVCCTLCYVLWKEVCIVRYTRRVCAMGGVCTVGCTRRVCAKGEVHIVGCMMRVCAMGGV